MKSVIGIVPYVKLEDMLRKRDFEVAKYVVEVMCRGSVSVEGGNIVCKEKDRVVTIELY